MLERQKNEEGLPRSNRFRQPSNNLYIFEYRSSRSKSKKKNMWDMADTKYEKASYLLKKEEIKQKISQPSEAKNQMDHRSNIDRLMSILSKSRTFIKTNDSGCQKVVRAISRMLNSQNCLKGAIESMKKYTMTCSSHNLELFLQSKHNLKETVKIKQHEPNLEQINENEENGETSKHVHFNTNLLNQSKDSISFQLDTPLPVKTQSKGNITTQDDLSSEKSFTPIKKCYVQQSPKVQLQITKQAQPRIAKSPIVCNLCSKPLLMQTTSPEEITKPLPITSNDEIISAQPDLYEERESDQIQLMFSEVAPLFKSVKKPITQSQTKLVQKGSKASRKCPSPIYNLLYSIPISVPVESDPKKPSPSDLKKSDPKSKLFKKQSRTKEGILTPSQYAQKMLYGQTLKLQQKLPEQQHVRNPLMLNENPRKRITSLPKITFTYSSREKYQLNVSPDNKQTVFPITVYKTKKQSTVKESSFKNTSKGDLHTTFSSKQNASQRNNPKFVHPPTPQENQYHTPGVIRNPIRHYKIAVSPRMQDQSSMKSSFNPNGFGFPQGVRNQYYGDNNHNMKNFDMTNQAMEQRRERVLTAQPGWQKDVEFVSTQRQLPLCCWQGKEIRSRSLNDRMLIGNNAQNRFP